MIVLQTPPPLNFYLFWQREEGTFFLLFYVQQTRSASWKSDRASSAIRHVQQFYLNLLLCYIQRREFYLYLILYTRCVLRDIPVCWFAVGEELQHLPFLQPKRQTIHVVCRAGVNIQTTRGNICVCVQKENNNSTSHNIV